jgi:predicted ABC-type ATPase
MKQKTIYLLLGPKGSGKSYIGDLINGQFLLRFIRVEDWAKKVKKDREIDDEAYIKEFFQVIENVIREELTKHDNIVFESTGLSDDFDMMFNSLKRDFNVKSISIIAQDELCLSRVRTRDQSIQVDVSDDQVERINKQVKDKGIIADFSITNNDKTDLELIDELKRIIK